MRVILLGAPGSGKGTLGERISRATGFPRISTGDLLRKAVREGTPVGRKAEAVMKAGGLVDDATVTGLVRDRIAAPDCLGGYILDGFPRTVYQAEELDKYLKSAGKAVDRVIDLDGDEEQLLQRMIDRRVCRECGATYNVKNLPPRKEGVCDVCGGEVYQRADDTEETVRNRFEVYKNQTKPLIDYYEKAGNIVHIDGTTGLSEVFNSIVSCLGA